MNLIKKVIKCSVVAGLSLPVFFNSLYAYRSHGTDEYHTTIYNNTNSAIYVCGPEIHMTSRCETDLTRDDYLLIEPYTNYKLPLIRMSGILDGNEWERCVLRFPLAFDPSDITGEGRDSNMVFISEMTAREHDDSGFFWYDDKLVEDSYKHGEENAFVGLCYGEAFPTDLYNVNISIPHQEYHAGYDFYYENWVRIDINENVEWKKGIKYNN